MGGGNTCEVSSGVIKEKYFWNLEFLILDLPPLRIRSQQRSDGTCFFFLHIVLMSNMLKIMKKEIWIKLAKGLLHV